MDDKIETKSSDLHLDWEQALGQPLTTTEFDEIKTNLRDFFELLHNWSLDMQEHDKEGI